MDLFRLIQAGGWMLLPLFVCSVLVIAIFIERFRYYRASRSDFALLSEKIPEYLDRDDFTGLQDCLKKDGGLPASVLLPAASRPGRTDFPSPSIRESRSSSVSGNNKNHFSHEKSSSLVKCS